jgi:XRE family aerobic/anaerobic benzoate catabolism transcriptional regulator
MDDDLLRSIGTSVQRLRAAQSLSLDELAERSALSPRFLSDIVAGRGNVSIVRLARLARALGTTAAAMLAAAEGTAPAGPGVVALLGVRGAGKSTIGPRLARRLGVPFVELDARVEEQAGLSLSEIFATHGEAYFRRLEVEALRRLLASTPHAVVATGGGIIENPEAWALLDSGTITVWLRAGSEAHWTRVVQQGDPLPMAGRPAAKAELRRLLAARTPLYRRARHRIDTERLGIAGSVRHIAERVQRTGAVPRRARA